MKKLILIALVLGGMASATYAGVNVSIGFGLPLPPLPPFPRVVVAHPPVYAAPVFVAPPVCAAPVVVAPPVCAAPIVVAPPVCAPRVVVPYHRAYTSYGYSHGYHDYHGYDHRH